MGNIPAEKHRQDLPADRNIGDGIGSVRVHESVISSIVRKTVLGTKGVLRFAGSSLVDNIAEFVGSKAMQDRAITVEMEDGTVSVEVQVILEYGVHIPEVAEKIQTSLRARLQELTGMKVGSVNVAVMDIETPQEKNEENSES